MTRKLLGIACIFILNSQLLFARDDIKVPRLNNHNFVPVTGSKMPFINTAFMTDLGVGSTLKYNFPVFNINGVRVFEAEGEILFLQGGASYQQQFTDWMAMYIEFSRVARIGTNAQSILTQGITNVGANRLGWVIRMTEGKKYLLSGNLELNRSTGTIISISDFVKDILAGNPDPRLTRTIPVLSAGGGLRYAYAFNDLFGMNLHADASWGGEYESRETIFWLSASYSFDVNFSDRYDTPLGLAASYQFLAQPEVGVGGKSRLHGAAFKIAYTGSPDFSLGLEGRYYSFPSAFLDKNLGVVSFSLASKFYF